MNTSRAQGANALAEQVNRWVRPAVRALSAYHVPDAGKMIKLDAMENPYRWPTPLVDAWLQVLHAADLNRYPDPQAGALKARLRTVFNLPSDMDILLGNGSDEIIQLLLMSVAGPGRVVLAPEPSFSMYRMISAFVGLEFVGVPLRADYSLDMVAMRELIAHHQPAVVFVAYPNNPTGDLFDEDALAELIRIAPGLVVVDEAYSAFCDASFIPALGRYPNLLVLRTLSKLGLAGLRLGYLVGPGAWLHELDKIRLPYNINVLTQLSAEFALGHYPVLEEQARHIRADRAMLVDALGRLPGVRAYPSAANFILFRVPAGRAADIFAALKERGVLIKSMHGTHPLLADCLRVTVGTPQENQIFLAALAAVV